MREPQSTPNAGLWSSGLGLAPCPVINDPCPVINDSWGPRQVRGIPSDRLSERP